MANIADETKPMIERVDDIPVIYGMLEQMGIQAIADRNRCNNGYAVMSSSFPD
jgi:hypothetical protein